MYSFADVSGAALFYLLWLPARYPALYLYVWLAAAALLLVCALAALSAWRDRRRLAQLCAAFLFASPFARLSGRRWTPQHRRTSS